MVSLTLMAGFLLKSLVEEGFCFCAAGDGDLQNLLRNMSQQQLMQLLGGMGIGGSGGGGGLSGLSQQLMGHGGGGGSGRTTSAESNT